MALSPHGLRIARGIRNRFLLGSLLLISIAALSRPERWDREGAQRALNEARALRNEIAATSYPSRQQYLRCAQTYRTVYSRDPHFSGSDDAVYEQALIYEEMGDKFGLLDDYKRAAKLFTYLIDDYGASPFCPDALLKLGDLYVGPLEDQQAAEAAFTRLRTQYPYTRAAASLSHKKTVAREEAPKPPPEPRPAEAAVVSQAATPSSGASVQNIRYWTTSDYTRVVIDLEGETRYHRTHLSNPDRIYFDISNSRLSHDLLNHKFVIGDDFLKQVRVAQNRADVVRVVLDFAKVSDYSVFELHDPFRIVIDIYGPRAAEERSRRLKLHKARTEQLAADSKKESAPEPDRAAAQTSRTEVAESKTPAPPKTESAPPPQSREQAAATTAKKTEQVPPPTEIKAGVQKSRGESSESPKQPLTATTAAEVKTPSPRLRDEKAANEASEKAPATSPGGIKTTASPVVEDKGASAPAGAGPVAVKPTAQPAVSKMAETSRPSRADLPPPSITKHEPSAPPPKIAAPTSRGDRTLTRILGLKIGRIVIDPGHGGHDTGTIGPNGLMEKDLVLEVARDLRKLLEERLGAEVVLTRDSDRFISLEERTAIANQHRADLFVSIHANSSNIRSLSGVETYYLDFARTAAEREVAARENASTVRNVHDLESLVKRIAQADKSAESRELASMIQKKLYVGAQKLFPNSRNRGVRRAPFVVLIGANMPSVLAEVAFISNPRDEKLLKKGDNREHLALALFAGIEGYMKTLASDVAQNHSGPNQ